MEDWRTYFCFGEVPEDWVWGFCLKNSLFKIDNTTEIILGDLWEKKQSKFQLYSRVLFTVYNTQTKVVTKSSSNVGKQRNSCIIPYCMRSTPDPRTKSRPRVKHPRQVCPNQKTQTQTQAKPNLLSSLFPGLGPRISAPPRIGADSQDF